MSPALREKLDKLLALADRGTPGEAAVALEKAWRLCRAEGEDLDAIRGQAAAGSLIERKVWEGAAWRDEHRQAAAIVTEFYGVSVRLDARSDPFARRERTLWSCHLTGAPADVDFSEYVFGFLHPHFAWLWTYFRGRNRDRSAYIDGLGAGLWSALTYERACHAPAPEVPEALATADDEPEDCPAPRMPAAFWAGMRAGQRVRIHTPITTGAAPAPLPDATT
ncbi:DUF2786 domain-containing protein [Geminisphaera colitermitum]|uniref:DUF2786 domain-containing protein n=2 Tax=Geminisphaera colitermitum TaxID=1148786 RepID=UPI000158D583|nr:DUF2786 domain-containing protein [Geminisphaera colitermitum]